MRRARPEWPLQVNAFGSLLTPFFTDRPVRDYQSATHGRHGRVRAFFRAMLAGGVYLPPSQFEAWFLSAAHTEKRTSDRDDQSGAGCEGESRLYRLVQVRLSNVWRRVEPDAENGAGRHVTSFPSVAAIVPPPPISTPSSAPLAPPMIAADDCADTGSGADFPGFTFDAFALERLRDRAAHRIVAAAHGDLIERYRQAPLPIRAASPC